MDTYREHAKRLKELSMEVRKISLQLPHPEIINLLSVSIDNLLTASHALNNEVDQQLDEIINQLQQ